MHRPCWFDRISASLDDSGMPVAWSHRFAGSSVLARRFPPAFRNGLDHDSTEGAIDLAYALPNLRVEYLRVEPPGIPTAFWRSVGPSHNVFVVESFVDELAAAARQDPVAYRPAILGQAPRAKAVLELAAGRAGWGRALPERIGRGVSLQSVFTTHMEQVAEVEVSRDGAVRVRRVVCTVDCGTVVNPNIVWARVPSGVVFGITAALYGEITLKGGRVEQGNFDTYRILRMIVPYLHGYGTTRFRASETARNGQQAVLAVDVIALMDALGIGQATLAGFDWGARTANIVSVLWPDRCKALVSVSGYLIGSREINRRPLPPEAEYQWWYQFYFATERGALGYDRYRRELSKLIWRVASPKWDFDDATFDRSAASFDNPDHVGIVIHNYRWRLSLAEGEARYDEMERRLGLRPVIAVPTITLEGDADGAPHADLAAYRDRFSGRYAHRLIRGGIGHNLPQEAPRAFADVVLEANAS